VLIIYKSECASTTAGLLTPHLSLPIDNSFVARSDVLKDVLLRMHVL